MWSKILKWFNVVLCIPTIIGFSIHMMTDSDYRHWIISNVKNPNIYVFIIIAAIIVDVTLLVVCLCIHIHKKKCKQQEEERKRIEEERNRRENLLAEFEFLVTPEDLTPERMGFESKKPGEKPQPGKRPHYPKYIERRLIRGEKEYKSGETPEGIPESRLQDYIAKGKSFAVIGTPTAGKSRTLYETLKKSEDILVMKPRTDKLPSDEALNLCKDKRVVILLDDLEKYAGATLDIKLLQNRLDSLGVKWSLACGCRNGPELGDVRKAKTDIVSKILETIHESVTLRPPDSNEKRQLTNSIFPGENISDQDINDAPTIGLVVLASSITAMRERFKGLSLEHKDCLSAIQLLLLGNVLPLTEERIVAVMEFVYNRKIENLRDILDRLYDQSFLRLGDIPVIPEMAYFRISDPYSVVINSLDLPEKELIFKLVDALERMDDGYGMGSSAVSLGRMGYPEDAIKVYDRMVTKFETYEETELRKHAAMALFNKGAEIRDSVARALFNKGATLGKMDNHVDEIKAYDEVVDRFGEDTDTELRIRVAMALYNKGVALGKMDNTDEEIKAYDEVVERFEDDTDTELRIRVANALYNKGATLGKMDNHVDEIKAYDEVVERFGEDTETELRIQVAKALYNKGVTLGKIEEYDEAIKVYDEVVDRFGEDTETELRIQIAMALFSKGVALGKMDNTDEEIKAYDEVVERFEDDTDTELRIQVAKALYNKGVTLGEMGKHGDAFKVFEEVVERFGEDTDTELRIQVASALYNKGVTLGEMDNHVDEIKAYDEVVERFGEDTDTELRIQVAKALYYKGITFFDQNRLEEAYSAYCSAWGYRDDIDEELFNDLKKAFEILGRDPDSCP